MGKCVTHSTYLFSHSLLLFYFNLPFRQQMKNKFKKIIWPKCGKLLHIHKMEKSQLWLQSLFILTVFQITNLRKAQADISSWLSYGHKTPNVHHCWFRESRKLSWYRIIFIIFIIVLVLNIVNCCVLPTGSKSSYDVGYLLISQK